uniref:Uncharacterized protein n=1 Tax=Anguilla anguilla TaxID=7936 RepID=A0A0E9PMF3_ANGAN
MLCFSLSSFAFIIPAKAL